ncbi:MULTISPECIES: HAD family hydrolase [Streptomyces]|uniref:HAD family hydrolase n=1 Tax=Streptomyces TaxID=1883 RepID=UPI0023AFC13A|nr:haloacid dehalogenase-like hydrolase [Streptomyces sp. KA12]MDF0374385.1 haloacid dehalogenase-like hydrolase [Streptomyces sp. KA12]
MTVRAWHRLVLWDIDYTLLDASGATRLAFADAFHDLFGRPLREQVLMAGRCEAAVVPDLLRRNGVRDAHLRAPDFLAALTARADLVREHTRRHGTLMPGADATLAAVEGQAGIVPSVVTGNSKATAVAKLSAFDLDQRLCLASGAFGDEAMERVRLVRLAVERARRALPGASHDWAAPLVVGDTPEDMRAARGGGAIAVVVTTGAHDYRALRDGGADHVLDGLLDPEPLIELIRLGPSRA